MRDVRTAVCALVLVAAAAPAAVARTSTEPIEPIEPGGAYQVEPPPGMTWDQIRKADRLSEAVAAVFKATESIEGFNAVIPDDATSVIALHWKAPVPPAVAKLHGTSINGYRVEVVATATSEAEFLQAGDKVWYAGQAGVVPLVNSYTGTDNGAGLLVRFSPQVIDREGEQELIRLLEPLAGMPISLEAGLKGAPVRRQDDSDPWFGGGMMLNPRFPSVYELCSTGFAAVTPNGSGRLLSARHCSPAGGLQWDDGSHDDLTIGGAAVDVQATDDTMLIDPIGGTAGWVHGGEWNAQSGDPRYHLKVGASDRTFVGESVCSSGANSGEHCGGLEVYTNRMQGFDCDGPAPCHGFFARNDNALGSPGAVGGDSGGPVYHNRADGRVGARGIIWGGSDPSNCGAVAWPVLNCYHEVWFNDIQRVANAWPVTIETTP